MRIGKISLAALTAMTLMAAPVAAQAAPAAKAKTSQVKRVNAKAKVSNKLEGSNALLIGLGAAAIVVAGIIIASDGSSKSP
jgi:hypothetical protein